MLACMHTSLLMTRLLATQSQYCESGFSVSTLAGTKSRVMGLLGIVTAQLCAMAACLMPLELLELQR